MNKQDKIQEGLILLDDRNNYVTPDTDGQRYISKSAFPRIFHFKPLPIFEMGVVNQQWGNQQPYKEEYQFCATNLKAKRKNVFEISGT